MGFLRTVRTFYGYLRPYRGRVAAGMLCLFAVDALTALPPLVLKGFVDQAGLALGGDRRYGPFLWLGLAYALIALAQGVLRYFWRVFLIKSSHQAAERIRDDYFSKLQRLPPSFYDRHPIGDLMALATNDVEAVRFALGPGLLVFADAIFLFCVLPPAMLALSPRLTFLSLAPMLFVPFVIVWAEKLVHRRFGRVQEQFSRLTAFAQENIEGIRVVKAFVREWTQLDRFGAIGREFVRLNLRLAKAQAVFEPVFVLSVALGMVSLILFTGRDVIEGTLALGTFVAFTRYLDQLIWPMLASGFAVTFYQRGTGSLRRVLDVLASEEAEADRARAEPPGGMAVGAPAEDPRAPLLEARNLTFRYGGTGEPVLRDVSLVIGRGDWVALVGPVGGGKSTLVKLLTGLYPVPRGTLFWKGVDVRDWPLARRREQLAVVPQEVLLFSDTLGANVLLGLTQSESRALPQETRRKIFEDSLARAALAGETRSWEPETPIGEKGANLSGGQRARVTLARAYARNAPLLILDDALSSIDAATEKRILDRFDTPAPAAAADADADVAAGGRPAARAEDRAESQALLMITHRFARLSLFDRIYVMRNGEIIQSGSAAELSREPGLYRQLLELQQLEDELAG